MLSFTYFKLKDIVVKMSNWNLSQDLVKISGSGKMSRSVSTLTSEPEKLAYKLVPFGNSVISA
jgi:hypothetical protein